MRGSCRREQLSSRTCHDVSHGAMDLLDRIGRGELTYDQAVAEVIAEFGQPAE